MAVGLRAYVRTLVTSAGSVIVATRARYGMPDTDSTTVTIATDQATCGEAGEAYHAALHGSSSPAISRTLVVVKVGDSNYVVVDPTERAGEFGIYVVFDEQWQRLVVFSS